MQPPLIAILLCCGIVSLTSELSAAPVTLSFGGTERVAPRSTDLTVTTYDLQSGEILENFKTKPRARVTVDCPARFCLSAVRGSAIARVRGRRVLREYLGLSKGFGGEITIARNRIVRLAQRSTRQLARATADTRSSERLAATAALRVGVPGNAITINRELAELIGSPSGIASTIITTLVQAPCYRTGEAFSVVEVDPRILRERKKELDLIKKGYVRADPGFRDAYQPPNATVRASVSLNGNAGTASLELVNRNGQVIASATGASATDGWFGAVDQAALNLAGELCPGPRVAINFAACTLERCSCGPDELGYRVRLQAEGTAKLPVGGFMYASLPSGDSVTHACGGVAQFSFQGAALGCQRLSTASPENFNFSFGTVGPQPPACVCPRAGAPSSLLIIATAFDAQTGARDDAISEDVPCREAP